MNITLLSNSQSPVGSLQIDHGIPIRVIYDDFVCSFEVDSEAAGLRREEKQEDLRIVVKPIYESLTVLDSNAAVEPQIFIPILLRKILKNVNRFFILAENEDFVILILFVAPFL